MARWTIDQVLALAPDDAATRAAKGLTSPGKWSDTGSTADLVWGKLQGSGKEPYQVSVDLNGPAFRCTCPSRKFPCKHGLALLLIWAANDGAIGDASVVAPFAEEWAAERSRRSEARSDGAAKRAQQLEAEAADPERKVRREAARTEKIGRGLDELDLWLQDLARQGLATAKGVPYSFWDQQASRLVDAQAPGIADRVRDLAAIVTTRPDWTAALLAELGLLHLVVSAWRRRDQLGVDANADLRAVLGWATSLDEVRATSSEHDRWLVVGVRQDGEGARVRSQRTWLWGLDTEQWAMVLDFATGGSGFGVAQIVGAELHGAASFFAGTPPRRALLEEATPASSHSRVPRGIGHTTIDGALSSVATAIARNPWVRRAPVVLHDVRIDVVGSVDWFVVDEASNAMPVRFDSSGWKALAHTGDQRCSVAAELEDGTLWAMSVACDDSWIAL